MVCLAQPVHVSSLQSELSDILVTHAIRTHFQPIISLSDGEVFGYEALSRGPAQSPLESPDALFSLAEEAGLTWELEYTCRRLAIERYACFGSDKILFLNVNPHIIQDPRFHEGMTKGQLAQLSLSTSRVVLELTERTAITNFREFYAVLEHYKDQGFRMAIDDAGSGYSGLNLICQIKPKFLKLDIALIRGIHQDIFKQQMVKFSVDFARATETLLIAEGIEQGAELQTLLDLGVEYGQGFLLGRPQSTLSLPPEIVVEKIRANRKRGLAKRLQHAVTARVGDYCRAKEPCSPLTPCHRIDELFTADDALMGIPIVDDGKPVGLVMREKFYTSLGKQYGYSLFHNRPISSIMDTHPLMVDFHDPLELVAHAATQRDKLWLYDNILVTLNARYFGTITVMDLLERITEQGIKNATYANPLSGLPGNVIIDREIDRLLHQAETYAVLYIDLDNFKAYNDVYGFKRGDEIIKMTADLLQEIFSSAVLPEAFIGHIGGDDFVVTTECNVPETLLKGFTNRFDHKILTYYDDEHRRQGYITSYNRHGELEQFPFVSVSVAVVRNDNANFSSNHAIAKRAAEIKKACKAMQGSCYLYDRRGHERNDMPCSL